MVTGGGGDDSGRGGVGLGVGEGGGGAREGTHARNRGRMAGGGRSRGGATSRRAVELRSALDEMRRKRELTSGSHIRPDKYLAMPRGLSASLERTVREVVVTSILLPAPGAPWSSDDPRNPP